MPPTFFQQFFAPKSYICTFIVTVAGPHVLPSRVMLCCYGVASGGGGAAGGVGLWCGVGGGEAIRKDAQLHNMG